MKNFGVFFAWVACLAISLAFWALVIKTIIFLIK
jgi:hypothetical protein